VATPGDDRGPAARQRELLTPFIAAADALITTAAVPGRQAPMLVTREMVEQMKPGSVVVDLASESGGNVEGSVAGEVVRIGNAQVWGGRNVPSQMPGPASKLYAQNIVNLVTLMTAKDDDGNGVFAPDYADEIVSGSCVTRDGVIVHEPTRQAIEGPPEEAPPEALVPPASDGDSASYDDEVAADDGVPPDRTAEAAETDLPYDQEADQ
jgi:NAD(P) transhydrogenase subunit alpha